MIAQAWPFAAATALLALVALVVHTRVRGFLPEDPPGPGRKRHARPTPMLGAAPAAVALGCCALADAPWLSVAVGLAAVTGLVDDLRKSSGRDGLDWRAKAVGLGLAAVSSALALDPDLRLAPPTLALIPALFCLVNAFNFLDNQDGVSTSLGVVALGFLAWRDDDPLCASLCATWLAFLPFNWPRPRAFLGDSGAYALGVCAASLALRPQGDGRGEWLATLAPVAVPALDFAQVVCVRLVLGFAPWKADRRHLTHLLLLLGVPAVALAPLLASAALAVAWLSS